MRCTEHVIREFRKLSTSTTYHFLEKSFRHALNYIMKYLSDYNLCYLLHKYIIQVIENIDYVIQYKSIMYCKTKHYTNNMLLTAYYC